jgi:hypothetical protein
MGPECQSLEPTTPRPCGPPSDTGCRRLARAHDLTAAVSLPTIFPPPRRRRPSPLAAIKGAHPPPWSTLSSSSAFRPHCAAIPSAIEPPWTARSGLSPTNSTMPRAPRRRVQPPRTASYRPPPPDDAPTAVPLQSTTPRSRAHSSGELYLPAAPKRVHHPTALLPGSSPLHLIVERRRNPTVPPPAPLWPSALPCLTEMGHQPKWLGQSKAGRLVSARSHSATYHFSMRLKID